MELFSREDMEIKHRFNGDMEYSKRKSKKFKPNTTWIVFLFLSGTPGISQFVRLCLTGPLLPPGPQLPLFLRKTYGNHPGLPELYC